MSKSSRRKLILDKYFIVSLVLTTSLLIYLRDPQFIPIMFIPIAVGLVRIVLPYLRFRMGEGNVDLPLLYLLLHMYAVSTGKPVRTRLFQLNSVLGDYGDYEATLRRIAALATEWGYGFVRSIRLVSRDVRNRVFREFLLRFSEVLRTGEDPTRFLEVEFAAARRNYQAQYYRAMDLMRIILGMHTTLMSSAAFILTVMAVFMVFVGSNITTYLLTLIGSLTVVGTFTVITYIVVPKEWVSPNIKPKPRHIYSKYNASVIVVLSLSSVTGFLIYTNLNNLELAIMVTGGLTLLPGLIATKIENDIKKVESFYPIFVRSFGLTYSVLPNYVRALASILMSDYGALTKHIKLAYAKLSNGIDPKIVWRHFSLNVWSNLVMRSTNVLVDAVEVGGDLRNTGVALSDLFIRLNDLRSTRERIARTFEATTYILQILVTSVSISIINILQMFSKFMESLSAGLEVTELYGLIPFYITPESISFIYTTTLLFLVVLVIANALTIKLAYGGLVETLWIQISVLSIATASASFAMRTLVNYIFGQLLFPGLIPG
ncbi:MAG: hypothetical protein QXY36_01960 [Sulfolobales archaeon]